MINSVECIMNAFPFFEWGVNPIGVDAIYFKRNDFYPHMLFFSQILNNVEVSNCGESKFSMLLDLENNCGQLEILDSSIKLSELFCVDLYDANIKIIGDAYDLEAIKRKYTIEQIIKS